MSSSMKQELCKIVGKVELKQAPKAVIVTNNPAFGKFIKKWAPSWGYNEVNDQTPVVEKATKGLVKNRVVFGIIPKYLSKYAISTVELEVKLTKEMREQGISRNSLSLEQLEKLVSEDNIHEYVTVLLERE